MPEEYPCVCCKTIIGIGEEGGPEWACPECRLLYPASLIKAACDPFDYALGLNDGTIIRFSEAEFHGKWVTILGQQDGHGDHPFETEIYGFRFHRGLDIRLDTISWCADAPEGS